MEVRTPIIPPPEPISDSNCAKSLQNRLEARRTANFHGSHTLTLQFHCVFSFTSDMCKKILRNFLIYSERVFFSRRRDSY